MNTLSFSIKPNVAFGSAYSQGNAMAVGALAAVGGMQLGLVKVRLDLGDGGRLFGITATNGTPNEFTFDVAASVPNPLGPGVLAKLLTAGGIAIENEGVPNVLLSCSLVVPPHGVLAATGRITSIYDEDGDGDVDQADLAIILGNGARAEQIAGLLGAWTPPKG